MDFINQKKDKTCKLITLLNAFIFKNNKKIFKYPSKSFYNYFDKVNQNTRLKEEAYEMIGAKREEFVGNNKNFYKWFHNHIIKGNCIDITGYSQGLHSFLVCNYNKNKDSYMCVNSHIYSDDVVEWLPYALIIKGHTGKNTIKSFKEIKINNIAKQSSAIIFNN